MLAGKNLPLLLLVISNLIPLAGVFYANWDATVILLLYWAENLIIGFFNILKMLTISPTGLSSVLSGLGMSAFFLIHYGGFTGGHGLFLVEFLQLDSGVSARNIFAHDWWGPLIFIQLLAGVVLKLWTHMPAGMIWPLLALFISHAVSYGYNYIWLGENKTATINQLMQAPYRRIVILHIAIIAGGMLVLKQGSPIPLLIALVLIKIVMDIQLHNKEHRQQFT